MSAKHTPGPWTLSYDQGSYRDIMTKDARICTVRHSYVSIEAYHANARLIAAAPELLYALQCALSALDGGTYNLDSCLHTGINDSLGNVIRDAIAKAEGRQ